MRLLLFLIFSLSIFSGCDPEHKKKCEWYLMPDIDRKDKVEPGYIPVCARNFVTNKQDCRLQATMKFAKESYNKKFRYVDLKYEDPGIPRTVTKIKFCE